VIRHRVACEAQEIVLSVRAKIAVSERYGSPYQKITLTALRTICPAEFQVLSHRYCAVPGFRKAFTLVQVMIA